MTRRQAIEAGTAAAAAMAASGALAKGPAAVAKGQPLPEGVTLPATPPPAPRPGSVGFAIIGLGDYALKQIMPRFAQSQRCHIAALVSGNPDKLARVGEAYGVPASARYSYESFAEIAANPAVEAVYIILPTGLHAEWAERAFAAGKHVMCEKPMALSAAECERMIAASERAKRKLMIGYRCHFEPFNRAAMELTATKALGDLRLIRTEHSYRLGPDTPATNWRIAAAQTGGGPLEDYGIYGLQAALYLSGEMPERLSASAFRPEGDPRFAEVFAHVAVQMHFPSGAVAQVVTSYDSAGINMVEARGTAGALRMHPATGYGGNTLVVENGRERRTLEPGDPEVQFAAMLDHLAAAVREGAVVITPGEMGLRDLRLMEAVYASAASGRSVALNPDGTMRG
ncbi:Gfo/Idh/MocA family protein [Erythrobacter sp. CCH5-A1]|jgi:glucose-fructose oxidoreductase|uniref:Gfo/Idh/MocA family protein n=1 Tax=Erythrobacter sp. CCH5-A1 TaxID=1768792 RepID=UPI000A927024|nr:Gfo/Idh/MocA family oxidoreductase [Erythrobacter sp. CCH5-A1]